MVEVTNRAKRLYNTDLAPTPSENKNWGSFEIFNVWANDVQSLFGYTLAASLFLTYGLNGWAVFLAIILAASLRLLHSCWLHGSVLPRIAQKHLQNPAPTSHP